MNGCNERTDLHPSTRARGRMTRLRPAESRHQKHQALTFAACSQVRKTLATKAASEMAESPKDCIGRGSDPSLPDQTARMAIAA